MCLGLGTCAYGAARILTGARHGLIVLATGLAAVGAVRPHVAVLIPVSLLGAYLLRRPPRTRSGLAPFGKLAGLMMLGGILIVAVGEVEGFLGVDTFDRESVELTLQEVTQQTGQGGSYVAGSRTDLDARQLPDAFINVLFRPFPWEATNAQSLIASIEGISLMLLLIAGWRRLLVAATAVIDRPYLVLAAIFIVLFVYGFSSFANFGILVRQRVQVLPFLLIPLAQAPRRLRFSVRAAHAPALATTERDISTGLSP